jgi:hypothetical protein
MKNIKYIIPLLLLFQIAFSNGYNRGEFGGWKDMDKDKINTRHEVLLEENLSTKVTMSEDGRKVVTGLWICFYSGDTIYNASELDIDHLVPLKEAYVSGAYEWNKKKKQKYSNYLKNPNHLIAVKASENRKKGARDPCKYMPPKNQCDYLNMWIDVKEEWNLLFDDREFKCILDFRKDNCIK